MLCDISAMREEIHGIVGALRKSIYSSGSGEVRGMCRDFLKDITLKPSLTGNVGSSLVKEGWWGWRMMWRRRKTVLDKKWWGGWDGEGHWKRPIRKKESSALARELSWLEHCLDMPKLQVWSQVRAHKGSNQWMHKQVEQQIYVPPSFSLPSSLAQKNQ